MKMRKPICEREDETKNSTNPPSEKKISRRPDNLPAAVGSVIFPFPGRSNQIGRSPRLSTGVGTNGGTSSVKGIALPVCVPSKNRVVKMEANSCWQHRAKQNFRCPGGSALQTKRTITL